MPTSPADPLHLDAARLRDVLVPGAPAFPELETARRSPRTLTESGATATVLAQTRSLLDAIDDVPTTRYTDYRRFRATGDRRRYEAAYYRKRANLAAAALRLFLGQADLKATVQDHLWSICEETDWVGPAHEHHATIDLFAAETAYALAEALLLLEETLDVDVRSRVRSEVDRRVLSPYLRAPWAHGWYRGASNWNGVCNGAIAATFLLLEPDPGRLAQGLELALTGLQAYLATAFEEDGSSTEGVAYWHYGLTYVVVFAELLRARSRGAADLLASERVRTIAAYPAKMALSPSRFASFSDSGELPRLHPGLLVRLAERTGERSLLSLVAPPPTSGLDRPGPAPAGLLRRSSWSPLPLVLRDLLWWDGRSASGAAVDDALLPAAGVARLVARTPGGAPVVLIVKAGHNGENHNHNDVGSFVLHVDGETLLTDPGPGLYDRDYFGDRRYEHVFANSYGHGVPRIAGQLQGTGRAFAGRLLEVERSEHPTGKRVEVDLTGAYPAPGLASARRRLLLATAGEHAGDVWLRDRFAFSGPSGEVEEALTTRLPVEIDGATAVVRGERHHLRLTVEHPSKVRLESERLEERSQAEAAPVTLTRLRFALSVLDNVEATVRMELFSVAGRRE